MSKRLLKSVYFKVALCLVLMAGLGPVPCARTADVPDGLYLKDDRGYDEIGLVCRLDLKQTAPGLWQARITAANPALCGGVVEGEARLENNVAVFRDAACPDQGQASDCCVLKLAFAKDTVRVSGPACLSEQCQLAGVYYRHGALVKPVDQMIKHIRTHYYQTNKMIDSFDLDQKEMGGQAGQRQGLIKVYSNLGYPKKMVVDLREPGPRLVEEYYYFDNELLFCFRLTHPNSQPGAGGQTREDRFYFYQGQLIKWLDQNKNEVPSTVPAYQTEQQQILDSSARYLELSQN